MIYKFEFLQSTEDHKKGDIIQLDSMNYYIRDGYYCPPLSIREALNCNILKLIKKEI